MSGPRPGPGACWGRTRGPVSCELVVHLQYCAFGREHEDAPASRVELIVGVPALHHRRLGEVEPVATAAYVAWSVPLATKLTQVLPIERVDVYRMPLQELTSTYSRSCVTAIRVTTWDGDSLGEGASMMEPEIVKNRGLSRVSGRIVVDDVIHSDPWVRWTDLEEGSISSCGSSRWVARL